MEAISKRTKGGSCTWKSLSAELFLGMTTASLISWMKTTTVNKLLYTIHTLRPPTWSVAGCSLSASYTALLTWLLSLVPDHFSVQRAPSVSEPANGPQAPFEVTGLQQLFLDDQLYLFVAVSPTLDAAEVSAKMKKSKTVYMTILRYHTERYGCCSSLWLDQCCGMSGIEMALPSSKEFPFLAGLQRIL